MITRTLNWLGRSLGRPDMSAVLVGSSASLVAVWALIFAYRA